MPATRTYGGLTAEERTARRRAQLLDAGLEELGTRGLRATGVKDVCRRAGLTDRYFYESFKDGGALFLAVFDHATERLFAIVAQAVAAAEPVPEAQMAAAVEAYVRALADDPRLARVVFREAGGAGPEAEAHMRETLRRFADLMVETAAQHLPPDVDRRVLRFGALACVGAIERVIIEWQDGDLGLSIDEVIAWTTGALLTAYRAAAELA